MKVVEMKLSDLQPYENNPRKNDNAVPYVMESIKRYGFRNPIIIDKDGVIVAGHTRYLASIELGLDTVPCIIADDLTEEQIKEFRLVDNKTSEFADWDFDMLAEELQELDFDAEAFEFEIPYMDEYEPIDDEALGGKDKTEHYIKFDSTCILLTQEEYEELSRRLEVYLSENGVNVGFFGSLLW